MIISLPSLTVAILGFPLGYIADRIGLATMFVASLLVFTVAGVSGYFCTDIYTLLLTRVFLGVGIAGISTAATALMGIYYDGEERMRVMAIQSAFMGFGGVVLEIIGGVMADVTWNTPFLAYAIGIPILLLGLFSVRNVVVTDRPSTGVCEDAGAGAKPQMAFLYASIFMLMFIMFIVPTNLSDILTRMDVSMTMCGLILALMGFTQVITSTLYSRLKRVPRYTSVLLVGFILQAVCMLLMSFDDLTLLTIGIGLCGVGLGVNMPTIANNLSMLSPASAQGKTMGLYSCFMNLGTFVSAAVMGPVIIAIGYAQSFYLAAVVVLLFGVFSLLFGRAFCTAE